jgi:hypothetical protein
MVNHTRGGGISHSAEGAGNRAASVGFGVQVLERDGSAWIGRKCISISSYLLNVVLVHECPVAVAAVQVIIDHMVVTFLISVECIVAEFALL